MAKNVSEAVEIGYAHVDEIADKLFKRLAFEEQEFLSKMLIKVEASKKIKEATAKGKTINKTVDEFVMEVERRVLSKIVYQEAKQKMMKRTSSLA